MACGARAAVAAFDAHFDARAAAGLSDDVREGGRTAAFEDLPRALRWLRRRRGLTQGDIARVSGVQAAMVSRYETGQAVPRLDTLGRLLEAMEVSPTALGWALQVVQEGAAPGPLDLPAELPSAERAALQTTALLLGELGRALAVRPPAPRR